MDKIFSILFFGTLFTLVPLAIFLAGIRSNYLEYYEIHEFFNPYFANTVDGWKFMAISVAVGYLLFYSPVSNIFRAVYVMVIFIAAAAFIPMIGFSSGKLLFLENAREITLKNGTKQLVDVVYEGRNIIYYHTGDEKKIERLEKPIDSGDKTR
ncbi:MAG: hypothetical protein ACTTJS_00420 [Wolinella sp.]